MMSKDEIKPCPFCGSNVVGIKIYSPFELIFCPNCGATLSSVNAREQWNNRTMEETRLKPCPICGEKPELYESYNGQSIVMCDKCQLSSILCETSKEARALWNRRIFE